MPAGPLSQAGAYSALGKELLSLEVGVNRTKGTVASEVQSINKCSLAILGRLLTYRVVAI